MACHDYIISNNKEIFFFKCRYYFLNSRLVKYDELKVAIIPSNSCIYIFKKINCFEKNETNIVSITFEIVEFNICFIFTIFT